MAIKPERFSLGKHQPSVTGTWDKLPTSQLAKGKEGLLRSPLLSRKLNSSPVGPEVWVVGTFSATKALTPGESTQCEKATLKREKKRQFYCQIRSSLRGKWAVLSELLHSRQNFPCLQLRWRRIGENRENSSLLPIYKWERLRSNGENITLRLLQRSLHIATTRSHNEVASCNRAYLQIKFTTEPKVKYKNIEQIPAVLGEVWGKVSVHLSHKTQLQRLNQAKRPFVIALGYYDEQIFHLASKEMGNFLFCTANKILFRNRL